ncbi:MAG: gamma-glutamyltransferase [Proteobacteria bacterium]|nr:gamma-glutamyltransferase [Pseudomonadota bacterium]
MRDSTATALNALKNFRYPTIWRQLAASALFISVLSGCITDNLFKRNDAPEGSIGYIAGFLGAVSADEPQAALIGRDVLSSGGSAADAATAVGLAMAVTLPSAASLGGGGVCLAFDPVSGKTDVLDFLPRAPKTISGATRPSAVPGNLRGYFVLHARHGRLKWEELVGPAEKLARFGFQVSRAFAQQLNEVAPALLRDPEATNVFVRKDGRAVVEGDILIQTNLAAVLGRIRAKGVGDFYLGPNAKRYAAAVQAAGGTLAETDLVEFLPVWRQPISIPWEKGTIWQFAPPPAAAGVVEAEMMALLIENGRFEKGNAEEREHLLVEAAKRAFAERMQSMQPDGIYAVSGDLAGKGFLARSRQNIDSGKAAAIQSLTGRVFDWPETPTAATFAVIDARGSAVSCALSMNNTFGTGRIVPGFGVMMAAAPDSRGRTYTPLGPTMLTSELYKRVYLVAAASGGVTAPTALINAVVRATSGPQSVEQAMHAPRSHYGGVPDKVFVEAEMPEAIVKGLRERGHAVARTPSVGRVNMIYCNTGVPSKEVSCSYSADPRGFGIAIGSD